MGCNGGEIQEKIVFVEKAKGLFRKLHPLVVTREVEDALSWKETRDGIFSIRSLYCSFTRAYSDIFLRVLFGGLGLL